MATLPPQIGNQILLLHIIKPWSCQENPRIEEKAAFHVENKYFNGWVMASKESKVISSLNSEAIELLATDPPNEVMRKAFEALKRCGGDEVAYLKQLHEIISIAFDSEVLDPTERRLLSQAEELYSLGMGCLERSRAATLLCHTESFTNQAAKLLRLHNETVDALGRYRRRGEQKIMVQHVTVNGNGPAVVGASIS